MSDQKRFGSSQTPDEAIKEAQSNESPTPEEQAKADALADAAIGSLLNNVGEETGSSNLPPVATSPLDIAPATGMQGSISSFDQQALTTLQSLAKEPGVDKTQESYDLPEGYITPHAGQVSKIKGRSVGGTFFYALEELTEEAITKLENLVKAGLATKNAKSK